MIEDKIESLDFKQTLIANFGMAIDAFLLFTVLIMGLNIIENLNPIDPILNSFVLIMFLYLFIKLFNLRSRFTVVYKQKKGGYIRYD